MVKLVIHVGMPKTGTTALQRQLAQSSEVLRKAGIDYPEAHRDAEGIAHHGLARELLSGWETAAPTVANLEAYAGGTDAKQILISSEAFTNCLGRRVCFDFMRFIDVLGRRGDVSVVLALRRIDSFLESMYLHSTKTGETAVGLDAYMRSRLRWSASFFSALSAVRHTGLLFALHFVKYERESRFQRSVLEYLGIGAALQTQLQGVTPTNEKLSWKGQVLLLHLPAVATRIGTPLERVPTMKALASGAVTFEGDVMDYTALAEYEQRYFHEAALAAAYKAGVMEYVAFFGDDLIGRSARVSLDVGALTSADLDRVRHWAAGRGDA